MAHGKERFKPPRMQNKGVPVQGQKGPVNINIPLNQLDDLICGNCEAALFIQVFAMKHLPALYNPQGREGTVNAPAGVMCVVCGAINNVRRKGVENGKDIKGGNGGTPGEEEQTVS